MKSRFAVKALLIPLILSLSASAQFTRTVFSQTSNDSQEIRQAIDEVERAFLSRDAEPFEKLYLEGYVNLRDKPVFNYREQLAAMVRWDAAAIKAGKKLDYETLSYESDVPSVITHDDVAIVNVVKRNLWRYRDDKCLTQYPTTELWLRSGSMWKIAAAHMSTIQCEKMPWQPPHPALKDLRPLARPVKFISVTVETELRELLSKLDDSGMRSDTNADAFLPDYVFTAVDSSISGNRSALLNALKVPTLRNRERYRDDEIFLSFGPAGLYLFRIRAFPKPGETTPPRPVVFSVFFVKSGGGWKIAAAHSSEVSD